MFSSAEFRFNETDPAQRVDHDRDLVLTRRNLIRTYLDYTMIDTGLRPGE